MQKPILGILPIAFIAAIGLVATSCGDDSGSIEPEVPPSAPVSLTATAASTTEIDLSWVDTSENETSFVIEQRAEGDSWSSAGSTGANQVEFTAGGLSPRSTYQFRVKARGGAGDSGYSNEAQATTLKPEFVDQGSLDAVGGRVTVGSGIPELEGTYVEVPEGALSSTTTISIESPTPENPEYTGEGEIIAEFLPDGLVFDEPIEIGLPIPDGANASDLKVYYWDDVDMGWREVITKSVNISAGVVTAETNHFTKYLVKEEDGVEFWVDVTPFAKDGEYWVTMELLTPFDQVPTNVGFWNYQYTLGRPNLRSILEDDPLDFHVTIIVRLKEDRGFWTDRRIASAGREIWVSGTGNDIPNFISAGTPWLNTTNRREEYNVSFFPPSQAEAEGWLSGAPTLIPLGSQDLNSSSDYYLEGRIYFTPISLHWSTDSSGNWFSQGIQPFRDAIIVRSQNFQIGDLSAPDDRDGDNIRDEFDPVEVEISTPSGTQSGDVSITFDIDTGSEGAESNRFGAFFKSGDNAYFPATVKSVTGGTIETMTNGAKVITGLEPGSHTLTWDSRADEEGNATVRFRLTLWDSDGQAAETWTTGSFSLQNRTQAEVASVTVTPATASVAVGAATQFTATLKDASGNTLTGPAVSWASSNTSVAAIDSNGLATGVAPGTTTVSATSGGKTGTATLTVTSGSTGDLGAGFGLDQFSLIPAGSFQMGDITGNGYFDELPVHTVNITQAFYMQKTEVTQGQWKAVMGSNPSYFDSCGDDCPVEKVSWDDIQEFLTALNAMNPGANYRLPTEAEWEYAARAGTTGDYGGTGVLDEMGWYSGNSGSKTHPVAGKQANAWGLYDMHGNVYEWVQDWYLSSYYSVSPTNDPTGPSTGLYRGLRGGSWGYGAITARSALRNANFSTFRYYNSGFRLARTP